MFLLFFFQAEDGIRDRDVTGVQTCALPISDLDGGEWQAAAHHSRLRRRQRVGAANRPRNLACSLRGRLFGHSQAGVRSWRSEEHTSELQSHHDLVCRLLLEKKKKKKKDHKKKKKKKKKTNIQEDYRETEQARNKWNVHGQTIITDKEMTIIMDCAVNEYAKR